MKKICSKCKKEKDTKEFSKNKSKKDGLNSYCKKCKSEHGKEYYEKNKDKISERYKNYVEENRDKVLKRKKKSYQKNKDTYQKYQEDHKKEKAEYDRKRRESLALYNKWSDKISFCEEVRRDPNNKDLLQVKCTESNCRKWFNPTNSQVHHRVVGLNSLDGTENRFYCSNNCKKNCSIFRKQTYPKDFKVDRSREVQPELRELVLDRDNYECQRCGSQDNLECHHFDGIEQEPLLSADTDECITLCESCHELAHEDIGCRYVDLACK